VFTRLEKLELQSQTPEQVIFSTDAGPLTVTSPGPGIFRLSFGVAGLKSKNSGDGLIVPQQEAAEQITTEQAAGGFVLKTFFTELAIRGKPLTVSLTHRGRERLASVAKGQSKTPAFGHDAAQDRWCVAFNLPEDHNVFGLGEQPEGLSRRGQAVVQQAHDGAAGDTVVPGLVPLAWSPRGWGVLTVCHGAQRHAVGAAGAESAYLIEAGGETLDVFLFGGTPTDVLNSYTNLTGKPVAPPLWGLGTWISRSHYNNGAADALESVKQLREHGIACDVVLLDDQPSLQVHARMGFDWNTARMPEPLKLLSAIRSHNMQPVAMETPRVAMDAPVLEELSVKSWLLRDVIDDTTGLIDLTHPDAYAFWRDKHESRFKEGLAAVATQLDAPELEKLESARGGNGRRLANFYPRLFNRAAHEAAQRFNGDGIDKRAMVWNCDPHPAPFVGSHRSPVQHSTHGSGWDGLAQAVRGGISAGQCAVTAFSTAVGGAGTVADSELYVRWLAASVFFPHLHLAGVDTHAPWSFGAPTATLVKNWLKFRYRLIPYLMGAIEESSRNGLPLMRSMALAFPDDEPAHAHDMQFLCGPALLVAPITAPGGKVTVYFPRGERWHELATGNKFDGGSRYEFEYGLDSLPVFGREGHILCLGNECESTAEINTIRPAVEAWLFGLPAVDPCVTAVKVKVMQMQGNAYIKGLEGTKVLAAWGYEVSRRGAEVKVVKKR
jgi:alpha-D-xyloside xylohydrolase